MKGMERRAFLKAVAIAGATARMMRASWPRIKLSLSGRISEPIGQVADLKPLTYDEFLQVAKNTGYDAICIRPLQCNISTPLEEMIEMARKTQAAGLKVSMVTCDTDQPPNNDCSPFALLNIAPRLAMAEIFGTKLIRCQIKRPEHLGWAQRACDEAKERGLSIVHLSHPGSLFSNVDDTIDCLKRINRSNFGLTYEPVNWMDDPKGYGPDVIRSVAPWIRQRLFAKSEGTRGRKAYPGGPAFRPAASQRRNLRRRRGPRWNEAAAGRSSSWDPRRSSNPAESFPLGGGRDRLRCGLSRTPRNRVHGLLYCALQGVLGNYAAGPGDEELRFPEAVQRRHHGLTGVLPRYQN